MEVEEVVVVVVVEEETIHIFVCGATNKYN